MARCLCGQLRPPLFSVKIGVLIFTGKTHMENMVIAHSGFRIWECGQHLLLGEWRVHIGSAVFLLKSPCPKIMDCGLKTVSMRKFAELSGRLSSLSALFLLLVTHAAESLWALADTHSGGHPGGDGLWPLPSLQFPSALPYQARSPAGGELPSDGRS